MDQHFEVAGGSVLGRNHRLAGKNNQDALCCLRAHGYTVAVVCDGCGSGDHNEVGAQIGARLVATSLLRKVRRQSVEMTPTDIGALLDTTCYAVLKRLRLLAKELGTPLAWTINNYLLFTVVGALLTPHSAVFFSLGDGLIVVNEEILELGPFPNNAPPYLSYGLVETSLPPALSGFQVQRTLPIAELDSFLIGTDGVSDLIEAQHKNVPGRHNTVGPLCQFWQEERFFHNPDMIRRRLAGFNRDVVQGENRCNGLLPDDTTLLVGRRKREVPDEKQ